MKNLIKKLALITIGVVIGRVFKNELTINVNYKEITDRLVCQYQADYVKHHEPT